MVYSGTDFDNSEISNPALWSPKKELHRRVWLGEFQVAPQMA